MCVFKWFKNFFKPIEFVQTGGYTGGKRPEGEVIPPKGGSGNSKFHTKRYTLEDVSTDEIPPEIMSYIKKAESTLQEAENMLDLYKKRDEEFYKLLQGKPNNYFEVMEECKKEC